MHSQQQVRYVKQLEAFLKLTAAVAHDVNNLLSGILGYSDLLLIESMAEHLRFPVEEISNAAKRIACLNHMLSAFGNRYAYRPEVFDLSSVFQEIEPFIPRILGKEIEFASFKSPDLWPIRADRAKMKQALIALAVEMKTLMPNGGKLNFAVCNATNPHVSELDPGHYVLLAATSIGVIAADEVPALLLNSPPSSDSRPEETAYGLPSIYELVKMASGHMVFEKSSEQKLQVSLYLPAADLNPDFPK